MFIAVRVQPRSSRNEIAWTQDGLKVCLTAAPVDGAANEALIRLLADRLALPRRAIHVARGVTSRQKLVEIDGLTLDEVKQRIQGL